MVGIHLQFLCSIVNEEEGWNVAAYFYEFLLGKMR